MKLLPDTLTIIKKFIQTRVQEADAKGVVLGLSGGIDSATTLALAVSSLGSEKVKGLIMPFKSTESISLAQNHADSLNVETKEYNISSIVESYKGTTDSYSSKASEGNLHSRIRMSLLYGEAFSSKYLVIGTSNKSELLVGYYTKWGDGASDFLPMGDLYKSQVYTLARDLQVPSKILDRVPTAELWEGQSDEEELGISYDNLDKIAMFIKDHDKLNELSSDINNLNKNIVKEDYQISTSIIDNLFEKLGEISGTEEFANRLDDLYSLIDSEEKDVGKISDTSSEVIMLFDKEIKWRKYASKNLMSELEKYNLVIKNNIGLRLQSRLTKDQAKFVAKCNSVHRDISLNF